MASSTVATAERGGVRHRVDAFVTGIAIGRSGIGFATGDGTVRLVDPAAPTAMRSVDAHRGASLSLQLDVDGSSLLSGGDDGRLVRIGGQATVEELGRWRGRWLETVAVHDKGSLRAIGVGKKVHLQGRDRRLLQELEHASTATGAAFDVTGQRLAVSRYGGVTLWVAYKDGWRPTQLEWAGSHIAVTWSPSGKFIVTSMQENALHGWRLSDKKDMAMRGYPAKVRSMSWAAKGRWLATSGAESVVLWPFRAADGPMGKQPLTVGLGQDLVTVVAGHPTQPLVAAGFKDGLVQLARIEEQDHLTLRDADGDPVSALGWTPDGRMLAIGTEGGWAEVMPLAA